jgi:ParB-like chromosome segregation protein Spo0J
MSRTPRASRKPSIDPPAGLAIAYRPLKSLVPYARNSRTHSTEQIQQLKASLRMFGWTTPMAVAGDDMIYGHARLMAAIEMAETNDPIRRNPDPWQGPVVDLSALSDDERRAYVIADNQLAQNAGWDNSMLRLEMTELAGNNFDLGLLGFSQKELDKLMAQAAPPDAFEAFDENIETEHQCPRCGFAFSGGKVTAPLAGTVDEAVG